MGWIRVGRFDNFKGADTLLIEADDRGLESLIGLIRHVVASGDGLPLERAPGARVKDGLRIIFERSAQDVGLVVGADRGLAWRRSAEGWDQVLAWLEVVRGQGVGHQYIDGPSDTLQIMVAKGEYREQWWTENAV